MLWRALGRPGAPRPPKSITVQSGCAKACSLFTGHPTCSVNGRVIFVVALSRPSFGALCTTPCAAAAGTPDEAGARRWLHVQGAAVKCVHGLDIAVEPGVDVPGRALAAGRLAALLAGLPALTSVDVTLHAHLHRRPTAAIRAFLAGALRAITRCSSLQTLCLHLTLLGGLDQLLEALVRELVGMRSLEDVSLSFSGYEANRLDWPVLPSIADLTADLAGLPRLRALSLAVENVGMAATLPASMSRLAQLTSLSLHGFDGLRGARGWARLPALVCLDFEDCVFAGDGEAALPGMDALGALTCFALWGCPSMRVLPASLWRLPQLSCVHHQADKEAVADAARSALPVAGLPQSAPCFASMLGLSLGRHNLPAFPVGILCMPRLEHLDLSYSCSFEALPQGVSALTALTELRLGRHSADAMEVGGAFDARALGSLAGFPVLRELCFTNCSVLTCPGFQAAAAHPRLERLHLDTSHPAPGPSCMAFLGFVYGLLQRGRPEVLELADSVVEGAGRRDSRDFRAALRAVGYPLSDADSTDLV